MNRLLSVLLLSPSLLFAQSGAHRIGEVFTRGQGVSVNMVPFAKVQIFTPNSGFTVPATVYADAGLTQVKMQPLTADALGNFDYYVASGCFDEQYSAPGSYQFRQSYVCPGSGGSGGGGGNIGTVTQVNGVGPDGSGHVTILVGVGTVKSVNGTTPDTNGNVALAVAAGTVTSVNGITPVAGNVTVPINRGTVTAVNNTQPDSTGNVTISTSGGTPSVGILNQPNISNGIGGWNVDPNLLINYGNSLDRKYGDPNDLANNRVLKLNNQIFYPNQVWGYAQSANIFNGSYNDGFFWNFGSFQRPNNVCPDPSAGCGNFQTNAFHVSDTLGESHSSSIFQNHADYIAAYNMADKALRNYGYYGYMPGSATAGSDEGMTLDRSILLPSMPWEQYLSNNTNNTPGSSMITYAGNASQCAGNQLGSGLQTTSCLTAGQWVADISDPIMGGVHLTGYTPFTLTSPAKLTVTETMTPTTIVTSTSSLDAAPDTVAGDTVTIPFTVPSGFSDPATGHACVSSAQEQNPEEVGYTISGSNITFSGHRFPHYVPPNGALTISLNSCLIAYWNNDQSDNGLSGTNAAPVGAATGGKTFYPIIGIQDVHTLLVGGSYAGSRWAGNLAANDSSIKTDGSERSQFNLVPGAMALFVDKTNYTPFFSYAFSPTSVDLGVNSVPWGAGKLAVEGYNPADITYVHRESFDNPLPDYYNHGSAWMYLEHRGSGTYDLDFKYSYTPGLEGYRPLPVFFRAQPYNNDNNAGALGYFYDGYMAPTYCYLCSTRSGYGGNLDAPNRLRYLFAEGAPENVQATRQFAPAKAIIIDDIAKEFWVGAYPWHTTWLKSDSGLISNNGQYNNSAGFTQMTFGSYVDPSGVEHYFPGNTGALRMLMNNGGVQFQQAVGASSSYPPWAAPYAYINPTGAGFTSISTNQAGSVGTTCTIAGYVTLTIDGTARKIAYCQ